MVDDEPGDEVREKEVIEEVFGRGPLSYHALALMLKES